jgi:hypothetical protein
MMDLVDPQPLDCVGEKREVWVALAKIMDKYPETKTIRYFREKIYPIIEQRIEEFERDINTVQTVPQVLPQEIQKVMDQYASNSIFESL